MKRKATSRKVVVRNGRFVEAVRSAVATRRETHDRIVEEARSSGIIEKLVEINKKAATA